MYICYRPDMNVNAEATFTDFLRSPRQVTDQVKEGDVILRRRGDEDLLLSIASRVAATQASLAMLGRLLADAMRDDVVREHVANGAALPWLKFLSEPSRALFYKELFECVEGAAALGTLTPIARLLDEWQATAAIAADPELAARLSRPLAGDGGLVPRPNQT
jgi:hypothetical protein